MTDWTKLTENLEARDFTVRAFATAAEAADYLDKEIDGVSVGFGGSMTVQEMGLYPRLAAHNNAVWHWDKAGLEQAAVTDVYIASVNGLAETGELINIDGTGNRVASSLFGHKKVYFIAGKNKISPDFHTALHRLRNVVAPKNAQRLGRKTPCALRGDRCYDCDSPERICRGLVVHYRPMNQMEAEVVLIDQELGY